jgi:hypothetical protein
MLLTRLNRRIGYGRFVLRESKDKRSMEPRQLRLPGFTRFWVFERRPELVSGPILETAPIFVANGC